MVTLEQVEQLDQKVKKVVNLIEALRLENSRLNSENSRLMAEKLALEEKIAATQEDNSSLAGAHDLLEKGIIGAINQLSSVEERVIDPIIAPSPPVVSISEDSVIEQHTIQSASADHQRSSEDDQKPLDIF